MPVENSISGRKKKGSGYPGNVYKTYRSEEEAMNELGVVKYGNAP
jgi:hypothetical protein